MNKKLLIIILLLGVFFVSIQGFAEDRFSDQNILISRIKNAKTISVYITSIFYVKDQARRVHEERKYGTGFIVDTTKAPGLKVVTNKHVLEFIFNGQNIRASKVLIKVNLPNINEPVYYTGKIIGLSKEYDIGVLLLDRLYNIVQGIEMKKTEDNKVYVELAQNALLVEQQFSEDNDIKEGAEVYFIGYPLRLGGEEYKNFPVIRKGIVAQVIPGNRIFLMDGFASRGNSGSPALWLATESPKLLGIIQGTYPESYSVDSSFNSGLSVVINASVIKDYIYELIDSGLLKAEW